MTNSILESTKKALGISSDYDVFDSDIIMHINSAFATLNQLGVGPATTFEITDNTETWELFKGTNASLNPVRSYIWAKVRLSFDPPTTSFAIDALQKMCNEFEWRLNVQSEESNGTTN